MEALLSDGVRGAEAQRVTEDEPPLTRESEEGLIDVRAHLQADLKAAAEAEVKQHLARELHDRVAQTLTTMVVEMENFKVEQFGRQSVITGLNDLQDSTREVLNSLRRLLYDLRGEPTIDNGFLDAVQSGLLNRFEERAGVRAELVASTEWSSLQLPAQVGLNLYRIVEEALNNVRQHSRADSVKLSFDTDGDGAMVMAVTDDGVGVPPEEVRRPGLGTLGMRERAILLGGKLRIQPIEPHGTMVQVAFPPGVIS